MKLTPAVLADTYKALAPPSNVAAAAFVGMHEMIDFAVTRASVTVVEAAALRVNEPVVCRLFIATCRLLKNVSHPNVSWPLVGSIMALLAGLVMVMR
jgi:hypothetical protein